MQAIRAHKFGGPEQLQLDNIDDPVAGSGEVVIDIKAVGVNPACTYMLGGAYAIKPELPYIPGPDAAGVISSIGTGVDNLKVGDRVFVGICIGFNPTGCYAQKVLRKSVDVVALPDNVSFAEGAALGTPYFTAHYGLLARGGAKAGECVFIHGASGAVGTASIQLAKRAGMTVIASAGTSRGLELIEAQGADHVVDHTATDYMQEVTRASGGDGPNLILEMLANVNLAADLEVVAKYGRIIVIGNRGEITINPRVTMMKELDVRGMAVFNASDAEVTDITKDLTTGLSDGSLKPVIGRELSLSEAAESHRAVLQPGAHGKIVLLP